MGNQAIVIESSGIIEITELPITEPASDEVRVRVSQVALCGSDVILTQWMFDDKAFYENFLRRIPISRLGEPEDFMGILVFLVSSASNCMTGAVLDIDDGYSAG